jgi:hypothetical protein
MVLYLRLAAIAAIWMATGLTVCAQTTGSVSGPTVKPGPPVVQYRVSWLPGEDGRPDRVGQRLEWDTNLDDRHDLHLFASAGGPSNDQELTSLNSELVWALSPETATRWKTALRFDASVGLNGRPSAVGMDWINEFTFDDGWSARAMLLTAVQIGENRRDGIFLQSRFRVNRRLAGGQDVGVELYDGYGSTEALGSFNDENHRAGPYLSQPLANGWKLYSGVLLGLSDRAAGSEFRLWIAKSF